MEQQNSLFPTANTRIGFHYFPDTLHYRESDLATWLPELQSLGVSWLVLHSAADRAIPESFLSGLASAGIHPLIQFHLSLAGPTEPADIQPLLESYARWGACGVVFFDRPNSRTSWPTSGWAQQDLVERFLDRFLPLACSALDAGLTPILPPLEPGGNYWDTAFLRAALESLVRRKQSRLLQSMALGAYAWGSGHSLNWGAGGPETWPDTRPYLTPTGSQDQRGFRIFDWYQTISMAVLGQTLPLVLFQAGAPSDPMILTATPSDGQIGPDTAVAIARLLAGETIADPTDRQTALEPIPQQVIAASFWLLADDPASLFHSQAFYQGSREPLPAVQALKAYLARPVPAQKKTVPDTYSAAVPGHPIRHYLLLPTYEWGVADWHLDVIKPFVKKHAPAVGFSLDEARLAQKVTVVGSVQTFPETDLENLRASGCTVERISGDGTSIASQLAER
ncbi:MAG TPA: hypothetical protein VHO48_13630 [Anaerolineaceae bacterium]|nr:hypothetical protein [Anaerolineaceae bacterium]